MSKRNSSKSVEKVKADKTLNKREKKGKKMAGNKDKKLSTRANSTHSGDSHSEGNKSREFPKKSINEKKHPLLQ